MATYKVLKRYKDKKLGKNLEVGEVVDMTVTRAKEVETTLRKKGYKEDFIERLEEKVEEENEEKE